MGWTHLEDGCSDEVLMVLQTKSRRGVDGWGIWVECHGGGMNGVEEQIGIWLLVVEELGEVGCVLGDDVLDEDGVEEVDIPNLLTNEGESEDNEGELEDDFEVYNSEED